MEESHHRIIDHLELGSDGHHLQEDLSKGVLRTIHNVENGTLHFITIPPSTSSREQEYIESSLLGADLLSSHLPSGLLVDYISTPGPATPNNQFHPQNTNLIDHHGSIQTYTAEDLQTLVDTSSLQTSENDRKLFLQFVNKPNTPVSHEAPVIVTNPKDMSSVNVMSDHDKLNQSTHTQLTNVSHIPVATSGNNFMHYHHQDQLLNTTHSMSGTGNILAAHHNTHHHHPHHHGQAATHQIIQNTAHQQQQQNQSHLSSIRSMLQGGCSPPKLYHVASSVASTNIAISTATSQNCIQIPPMTPIKGVESPKRYINYQMIQNPTSVERSSADVPISNDNYITSDDLMAACEPRSDDDEDGEGGNALSSNNHFTNTYLPHKKRLSKKLVDNKSVSQQDQFLRDSVISNDNHEKTSQQEQTSLAASQSSIKTFACQLCSDSFDDQHLFFTHLKGHYEPTIGATNDDGKNSDPKKKPKLPRVKHTKKIKNDKSARSAPEEGSMPSNVNEPQANVYETKHGSEVVHGSSRTYQHVQHTSEVIVSSQAQPPMTPISTEQDNTGEFSETEDMLEGMRNVVQKVQDVVDTDTNDGLGTSVGRATIDTGAKTTWFQQQNQLVPEAGVAPSDMSRAMDFCAELDQQEIHINTGNENFVLFLNKSDFHEEDILEHQSRHHQQQQQSTVQTQPTVRQSSNGQQEPIASNVLQPTNVSTTSCILDAEQRLHPSSMSECDMCDIQILGLSTTEIGNHVIDKLVDFNLATPQLNEIGQAKPLKAERKSNAGSDMDDDDDDDGAHDALYYVSDEDDDPDENETGVESHDQDRFQHVNQQYPTSVQRSSVDVPISNDNYVTSDDLMAACEPRSDDHTRIGQTNAVPLPVSSAPPGKKKGRKKINTGADNGELEDQDASKKARKKYPCTEPDCDKIFNSKTAVRYHELQHKNERPYKCANCPKKFFTSSALKVHERLHSGEKPYKCEECGRAFRQWGDMKYHQSSIHSNEKTHQCEFCGKKFARRYSLVLHRKIHLNEKSHICDICNKAFRASSYLQSHRMIHTGEKPYACTICLKRFRCGGDMKRHHKTHERNKTATNSKATALVSGGSVEKSTAKVAAGSKNPRKDVIDLTKIKSETGNKVSAIQAPPVVTILSKDINHAIATNKVAAPTGPLVYLPQTAGGGEQTRKPDETVLMDVTRW